MAKGKKFEREFADFLRTRGWVVVGPKGVPDLIAIRKGDLRFVECKAGKGNLRVCQKLAFKTLEQSGYDVDVVSDSQDWNKLDMPRRQNKKLFKRNDVRNALAVVRQALESTSEKARIWAATRVLDDEYGKPATRALVKPISQTASQTELSKAIHSLMNGRTVMQTSAQKPQAPTNKHLASELLPDNQPVD